MQPSSLIFLVIIGIWAAYFVQYWVRRREHLATIRSVDAFSETMRVLERRAPLPSVDHGGQAPRTYAVSPARAMRPQVTVKRAEAHASAPIEPRELREPAETVESARAADLMTPATVAMRPGRAARGIVVLVGLAGSLIFGVLAALGVLVVWSFAVPLAMAGIGFLWLRAGVQAELRAERAARARARRPAARTSAPATRVSAPAASAAPSTPSAAQEPDAGVVASEPVSEPVVDSAPFDVASEVAVTASTDASLAPAALETVEVEAVPEPVAVLPELDEDDIPLTWDPRPVPRPTYTMKARAAERPAPSVEAEPAAEAELPAYDDVPQRRIAGG